MTCPMKTVTGGKFTLLAEQELEMGHMSGHESRQDGHWIVTRGQLLLFMSRGIAYCGDGTTVMPPDHHTDECIRYSSDLMSRETSHVS
jgi:hypothetical protein